MFNFDPFHREIDGMPDAIDLMAVWESLPPMTVHSNTILPRRFLLELQELHPIRSRQAAAQAIATARVLELVERG